MLNQLEDLAAQIQAVSDRAAAVAARVGAERIATRPRQQRWSVAECLTHLTITTDAYLPLWTEACRAARAQGPAGAVDSGARFKLDLPSRLLFWFLEPPSTIRFRAPRVFSRSIPVRPRRC